ncbi:hypothetical protein WNX29_10405, partial [Limosilactobacillus reuteri]
MDQPNMNLQTDAPGSKWKVLIETFTMSGKHPYHPGEYAFNHCAYQWLEFATKEEAENFQILMLSGMIGGQYKRTLY